MTAPGTTLGGYRIERPLGRGGMGAVFLAYDTTLHRPVALKVMGESADGETSHERLLREARNAAALNHPHICAIHEVGDEGGTAFIAMEYVEGRSLRDRIDEAGALPYDEAVRYAIQAADALAYAHKHDVVHRDFKAANVMITADGRLKVVDFGLARRDDVPMTDATTLASIVPAGVAAGTPYAMAPEQVRGERADPRADVWALGVLLYEMLTGAKPFDATTVPELFAAILKESHMPWPSTVPVAIRPVVERCLEKDPARRYQSVSEVQRALESIQSGVDPIWATVRYQLTRKRWWAAAIALDLLVVAVLGWTAVGLWGRFAGSPAPTGPIRLAVLPFENLTGDAAQEFFADGLTDETISQLGRLHPRRLSVIARTSTMPFKKRSASIGEIGRQLGVQFILEGSARREANRVRISVALIRVGDETQLWTDGFERELTSILTLQNDVAKGVAKALAFTLLPEQQTRLGNARAINPEAYEAYLKGLSFEANPSPANLNAALKYFELALEKDPSYAPAYTGVAGVWFARLVTSQASTSEVAQRAKAAIDKALELDDTLADAHFRLAEYETLINWNWSAADREFQRAIELNPNQATTRSIYADYLAIVRRPEEALAQATRAMELDPVSTQSQTFYARILMFTGRDDEAVARYRATLKATPDQQVAIANIRLALHAARRYEEAFAADQVWAAANVTSGGPDIAAALTRGYAEGGYRGAMRRAAEAQAVRASTNPSAAFFAAQFYARAGEHGSALDWLERAFDSQGAAAPYLSCAPVWDDLRGEPRFQNLLRRMNLPVS